MRRLLVLLFLLGSLAASPAADTATGRVIKVLPLFLDSQGRAALTPSLFDRDAYQAYLRQHTNEISAVRFDILWKAADVGNGRLKLRLDLRGGGTIGLPSAAMLEQAFTAVRFHRWTSLTLDGVDYKNFGSLVAWRATLWSDDRLLDEQKSFLW